MYMVPLNKGRKRCSYFPFYSGQMETKANSTAFDRLGCSDYPPGLAASDLNSGSIMLSTWGDSGKTVDTCAAGLVGKTCSKYKSCIRTVLLEMLGRMIRIS